MKNIPLLIGTIVGTLLLIVGISILFSSQDQLVEGPVEVDQAVLLADASNIKGAPLDEAEVIIVEFSDFQCPACRAAQPLVQQIVDAYPEQVSLVFRYFPLDTVFPNSRWAAHAAAVAAEYDLFWEMSEVLFEKQPEWGQISSRDELKARFAEYAEELAIDKEEFLERIEASDIAQNVSKDSELGRSISVNATPTFFVNGERMSAPQLLQTVDSLLASTTPQEEAE